MSKERLEQAIKLQDEYFSTWDVEEQTAIAHKYMMGFSGVVNAQDEAIKKLVQEIQTHQSIRAIHSMAGDKAVEIIEAKERQINRYREAIKKAIAEFNQDEHQHGMSHLVKALESDSE